MCFIWMAGHWSLDPSVTRGACCDADVILVMGVNLVVGVNIVPGFVNTVGHVWPQRRTTTCWTATPSAMFG